jgi:predicted outer membrane repeat protein
MKDPNPKQGRSMLRSFPIAVLGLLAAATPLVCQNPLFIPVAKGTAVPEIVSAIQIASQSQNNPIIIEVSELDPANPGQPARYLPFNLGVKNVTIRRQNPLSSLRPIVDGSLSVLGVVESVIVIDGQQDATTVIDGLEIVNGRTHGVLIANSSPVLRNCIIRDSGLMPSVPQAHVGGGVLLQNSASLFEGCEILRCSAVDGGGVHATGSAVRFVGCRLAHNRAQGNGGGVVIEPGSVTPAAGLATRFDQCEVSDNRAEGDGGGIYARGLLLVEIDRSSFERNRAGQSGGAAYAYEECTMRLDFCVVRDNQATDGGGVNFFHCRSSRLSNSQFSLNKASQGGGAVYLNDDDYYSEPPQIENVLFAMNHAGSTGGGLHCFDTVVPVRRCTFTANDASDPSSGNGLGGGIYVAGAGPVVRDSILWNNASLATPLQSADQITLESSTFFIGQITVTHSLWAGGSAVPPAGAPAVGYDPASCIDANPLFQSFTAGSPPPFQPSLDYFLDPNSPCIDAGDSAYTPDGTETTSVVLTNVDTGLVDLGYHRNAKPLPDAILSADALSVSAITGGTVRFQFDTRAVTAPGPGVSRFYCLACSRTGTQPGIALDSIVLPVVLDDLTLFILGNPGLHVDTATGIPTTTAPVHAGAVTAVDFTFPGPRPAWVGLRIYTAMFLIDISATNAITNSPSNPVELALTL